MIEVQSIASSSSGNCYRLISGQHQLLLEAGLPLNKIKQAIGWQLGNLDGCLVTHEHEDHARSVEQLIRSGVDVYLSRGAAEVLGSRAKGATIVEAGVARFIGKRFWTVKPFTVQHDAIEPLGYMVCTQERDILVFATDTFCLPHRFRVITHLMLECNYITSRVDERLADGSISFAQAKRLLHSHMSLDSVVMFCKQNREALQYCQKIWLLHGSALNGDPEIFKDTIQKVTGKPVEVCKP